MTQIDFAHEHWPLAEPFVIAGHVITDLDVIHVRAEANGYAGQGEGVVPVVFPDMTVTGALEALTGAAAQIRAGGDPRAICAGLPPGPARNALDCALWDLAAKSAARTVAELAGIENLPAQIIVDETIGLGDPGEMARRAAASVHQVLKVKLDAELIPERIAAVRAAAPHAALIVDANQSWSLPLLREVLAPLGQADVRMIEQPLPCAADAELAGLDSPIPIFADESCHTSADLPKLVGLYQGVNIKLDKTGGLSEALALLRAAKAQGLGTMVGCMAGTSLSMAPAYLIGAGCDWVDLDGPLLMKTDRTPAMRYTQSTLEAPEPNLWG